MSQSLDAYLRILQGISDIPLQGEEPPILPNYATPNTGNGIVHIDMNTIPLLEDDTPSIHPVDVGFNPPVVTDSRNKVITQIPPVVGLPPVANAVGDIVAQAKAFASANPMMILAVVGVGAFFVLKK